VDLIWLQATLHVYGPTAERVGATFIAACIDIAIQYLKLHEFNKALQKTDAGQPSNGDYSAKFLSYSVTAIC
jgi:hypothetical protein